VASIVADAPTSVVNGPFEMVVEVTGGGTRDIVLTPDLPSWAKSAPSAPSRTLPAGTCIESCLVAWRIDPASQATPWVEGWSRLGVWVSVDGRPVNGYGTGLVYQAPVQPTSVTGIAADPTANTLGYASTVADTGGVVTFTGSGPRREDEQVDVLVLPLADATFDSHRFDKVPLAVAHGTWATRSGDAAARGEAHLDTRGLAEGYYRLVAQARDSEGHYGYTMADTIVVRHTPMLSVTADTDNRVAAGREAPLRISLQNPRRSTKAPSAIRVTVQGRTSLLPDAYSWYLSDKFGTASTRSISVPTAGLPIGPANVAVDVLDVDGLTIGSSSATIQVVDFHDSVTLPTLVVGKSAAIRLRATAPAGLTLSHCSFVLTTPLTRVSSHNYCSSPGITLLDGVGYYVPADAGAGSLRTRIETSTAVPGPERTHRVTVYANRTATFSAPAQAGYNTVQTATVSVRDERKVGVHTSPGAGIAVTLQRKQAGGTAWTTIGRGTTGTTGTVAVKFTNAVSGRLRAVVQGAVPATTVTTGERSVISIATVAWSSLPSTGRSGATLTAAVSAKPYERGAIVRFQARKYGATAWITYGSGAVATNGYAKASGRLLGKGTWEVRVQRVGTTTQSVGYSSIRRIKLS